MIRLGNVILRFARYMDVFIFTGSYVEGRWVNHSKIKIQIYGSIQENNGKVLQYLPEGSRLEETKLVYSKDSLPIDDYQYSAGQNDIRFIIDNKAYRLIKNQKWDGDYSIFLIELLRADDSIDPHDLMTYDNKDIMTYDNKDEMIYGE